MITATGLELRAGARLLLDDATFRVAAGRPHRPGRPQRRRQDHPDQGPRRRGASPPPARSTRTGEVGYLPQDPRTGDLDITRPRPHALRPRPRRDRARRCRGRRARDGRATTTTMRDKAMRRYGRLEDRVRRRWAGTPPRPRPRRIASDLGLPDRVLGQPLRTLSGGQRRRVELARILFSGAETPAARRADQPPRRRLDRLAARLPARPTRAGSSSSATTSSCSTPSSTRCSTSTPTAPSSTSTTSAGRPTCSSARPTSGAASRERANAEKKAGALMAQADKMRAKATKAVAAQNMATPGRAAARRARGRAGRRQGRQAALPRRRRRAARRR